MKLFSQPLRALLTSSTSRCRHCRSEGLEETNLRFLDVHQGRLCQLCWRSRDVHYCHHHHSDHDECAVSVSIPGYQNPRRIPLTYVCNSGLLVTSIIGFVTIAASVVVYMGLPRIPAKDSSVLKQGFLRPVAECSSFTSSLRVTSHLANFYPHSPGPLPRSLEA